MAQVNESKGPFDGIDQAELSAWKRHPATRGLVAEMRSYIERSKDSFWRMPITNQPMDTFLLGCFKGGANAISDVADKIEAIK